MLFRSLVAYYLAHKPDDSDWVVLPVVFFDAFFGGTTFSKKILSQLPKILLSATEQATASADIRCRRN